MLPILASKKASKGPKSPDFRRRYLRRYKIDQILRKNLPLKTSFCFQRSRDFEEAFSLLYTRYLESGLIPPSPSKLYLTAYQALPWSRICITRLIGKEKVVSTATLVIDSFLGLPSDCIYHEELNILRKRGRKLAEYTCLATRDNISELYHIASLFNVFRLLSRYAFFKSVTDIVISIHPKHAPFYERVLLFRPLGKVKSYTRLNNALAILEHLDLTTVRKRFDEVYSSYPEGQMLIRFFLEGVNMQDLSELIKPSSMTPNIFYEFFIEKTNTWKTLKDDFKDLLSSFFLNEDPDQKKFYHYASRSY